MSKTGFVKIYSAGRLYEAELIVGLLVENGIEATIINKRDSEFLIGEAEVYVADDVAERALKIIDERGE